MHHCSINGKYTVAKKMILSNEYFIKRFYFMLDPVSKDKDGKKMITKRESPFLVIGILNAALNLHKKCQELRKYISPYFKIFNFDFFLSWP